MNIIEKIREKFLYLLFGGLTTLVNIAVYKFLENIAHIDVVYANAAAWIISVAFAYFTNRNYVFSASEKSGRFNIIEMINFFKYRIFTGAIDMALIYVLVKRLAVNSLAAKLGVNILIIILNYLFSKFLIFNKRR